MQRVPALEELEVAGPQREPPRQLLTAARQYVPYVAEVLVVRGADVRAVLEDAAVLGLLGEHADGELVGVEVPGVLHPRLDDVEHQPGQRVRQLVQLVQLEAAGDELLEEGVGVEPADDGVRGDEVPRDEGVAALEGRTPRVILRQVRIDGHVVDVDRRDVEVCSRSDGRALLLESVLERRAYEVVQHGAAVGRQVPPGPGDHLGSRRAREFGQGIAGRVDQIVKGHGFRSAHPILSGTLQLY